MIQLDSITKTFGGEGADRVRALDDLSLTIAQREFLVVVGTNGSGKSTLLNAIAGTVLADSGTIRIAGEDVTRTPAHARAHLIGRVTQNPLGGTAPSMTVAENLRLAGLRGQPKGFRIGLRRSEIESYRERARELSMGLEDRMNTPMGLLSGGQRQALTLLMATLREPRILLLDEHTAALDPKSAEAVMQITRSIVERDGLTAMMVTHDMNEAAHYGNRLVMMNAGNITIDAAGALKDQFTPEILLERFAELRRAAAAP